MLGRAGRYPAEALEQHEELGLSLAAVLLALVVLEPFRRRQPWGAPAQRLLLVGALILMMPAGHAGGTLTHGEGYLLRGAPPAVRSWFGAEEEAPVLEPPPAVDPVAVEARAVMERHCYECHGNGQAKGDLRLDTTAGLAAVIQSGSPEGSELFRRVTLDPDDLDAMPPTGEAIPAGEVEALRAWIAAGAGLDALAGHLGLVVHT